MRVDDFDFELPRERIATRPVRPRDAARMLVVRGSGLGDMIVRDLPAVLRPGDLMVFNDTRVIPARLRGRRGTASVEVTLHMRTAADRWRCFARPARKLRLDDTVIFGEGLAATVVGKGEGGEAELRFTLAGDALDAALSRYGEVPLPPYIASQRPPDAQDQNDYQTIFALRDGAVAAPTAGLHFTQELLDRLRESGIARTTITLHVGAGTFLPVKVEDTAAHRMHAEWGSLSAESAETINAAREAGGRIVAVGTTACRLLESAANEQGRVGPFSGETRLFITPGYRFRAVDLLMTNFHLPRSTLFMLVCAFAGTVRMKAAYEHAKDCGYRFYSYGDATLLYPEAS